MPTEELDLIRPHLPIARGGSEFAAAMTVQK